MTLLFMWVRGLYVALPDSFLSDTFYCRRCSIELLRLWHVWYVTVY